MTARSKPCLIVLAVVALACAGSATGPPVVHWGVDECSHCHMILGEQRFAAVARSGAGEEVRFDDLGCFARFLAGSTDPWQGWVNDSGGAGWLPAESAHYVRRQGLATPMGSGLTAWSSADAAASAAGEAVAGAEQLTWRQVVDLARSAAPT